MPNLNTIVQRLGIFGCFALASFGVNLWSKGFGPSVQVHTILANLPAILAYFLAYGIFFSPVLRLALSLSGASPRPILTKFVADTLFSTAVFSVSYILVASLFPALITIFSLPGLVVNILGFVILVNGVSISLSYKPKFESK